MGGRSRGLAAGERRVEEGARAPAQGGPVFRLGDGLVNRCQFVEDHQRRYGVKRLCTIVGIARSSFYYWRRTAPTRAARQAADAQLAAQIRAVHRTSDGTYGVPRITAELREDGERVNHKRVARVMKTATGTTPSASAGRDGGQHPVRPGRGRQGAHTHAACAAGP
ncbi:IS3 family transposase [Streptomyces sp. NPDC006285]|uniref:IS3 family transposase n=1 Tax=Streptomyces sp. NPDC006285 TaxID=3364742 RepID=UPI0036C8B02C